MSNILGNMPPVFGSGYRGVVPAPSAADVSAQNILRADGTWGAQATSGPLPSQTGNAGSLLTTNGTNASWASSLNTFQFGDVTLGTSGPSVKSSLSARAPRQGLVFDGTAGANFTEQNTSTPHTVRFVFNSTFDTTGRRYVAWKSASYGMGISSSSEGRKLFVEGSIFALGNTSLVAGKNYDCVFVYNGSTVTFYLNGIADGTTAAITTNNISRILETNQSGSVSGFLIYNRALSASEVVALYESGAPAGADYNTASNTSVAPASFASGWTIGGGSPTLSTTATMANGDAIYFDVTLPTISSRRYRAVFTTTGTGQVKLTDLVAADYTSYLSAGSQSVEFTLSKVPTRFGIYANGNVVVSSLTLVPIGLLLAPDAAQAGGGLTWYDTSGNAANITLPASGVMWNVPTSGNLAGNLQVNGTGNNVFRGPIRWGNTSWPGYNGYISEASTNSSLVPAIARNLIGSTGSNYTIANGQLGSYSGLELGTDIRWFVDSGTFTTGQSLVPTERMRLTYLGNFLIGTTSDAGDKLQVNGSISASPSGAGYLVFTRHGSQNTGLYYNGAQGLVLYTNTTTALTLDSSQNATFAGKASVSGTGSSDTLSYNLLLGGDKRLILGYDTTNDYGLISSIHTGQAWKNLVVNPIGGSLLIGMTAPIGSEKLQAGGSVIFNGYAGIADGITAPSANTGYAKIYVDSADGDLKVIFGDGTVKTIVTD